jgi:GH24 family phage-related lysozyme (muramidase)
MPDQQVSESGIRFIVAPSRDNFKRYPYDDGAGNWTVGYGTKISGAQARALMAKGVDPVKALQLLRQDIQIRFATPVNRQLKQERVAVGQVQFDRLASLAYNSGPDATRDVIHHLSKGDAVAAITAWLSYEKATPRDLSTGEVTGSKQVMGGLTARRQAEVRDFFGSGVIGPVWHNAPPGGSGSTSPPEGAPLQGPSPTHTSVRQAGGAQSGDNATTQSGGSASQMDIRGMLTPSGGNGDNKGDQDVGAGPSPMPGAGPQSSDVPGPDSEAGDWAKADNLSGQVPEAPQPTGPTDLPQTPPGQQQDSSPGPSQDMTPSDDPGPPAPFDPTFPMSQNDGSGGNDSTGSGDGGNDGPTGGDGAGDGTPPSGVADPDPDDPGPSNRRPGPSLGPVAGDLPGVGSSWALSNAMRNPGDPGPDEGETGGSMSPTATGTNGLIQGSPGTGVSGIRVPMNPGDPGPDDAGNASGTFLGPPPVIAPKFINMGDPGPDDNQGGSAPAGVPAGKLAPLPGPGPNSAQGAIRSTLEASATAQASGAVASATSSRAYASLQSKLTSVQRTLIPSATAVATMAIAPSNRYLPR